jgi:enediyne biosynthesis protein E4
MKTSLATLLCFWLAAGIGGSSSGIRFQDVGSSRGIRGVTICGDEMKTAVIEANGSGACWLDYNNDDSLDLFVVNGSTLDALKTSGTSARRKSQNYLYRNNGNGTFTELAETAGVAGYAWGTGCAAADYDNDGFTDLFVSSVGECFLFRNKGDGDLHRRCKNGGGFGRIQLAHGRSLRRLRFRRLC